MKPIYWTFQVDFRIIVCLCFQSKSFPFQRAPQDFKHGCFQHHDGPFGGSFCHLRDATSVTSTQFFLGSRLTHGRLAVSSVTRQGTTDRHKLCVRWTSCCCNCGTDQWRTAPFIRPQKHKVASMYYFRLTFWLSNLPLHSLELNLTTIWPFSLPSPSPARRSQDIAPTSSDISIPTDAALNNGWYRHEYWWPGLVQR